MLNRRDFFKTGAVLLTGLTALVTDSQAYPQYASPSHAHSPAYFHKELKIIEKEHTRERLRELMFFTYEEWKALVEAPLDPRTDDEIYAVISAEKTLAEKAQRILEHPGVALSLLTLDEIADYKRELRFFDTDDIPKINAGYHLNFSPDEFQRNPDAMLIWYLNQNYSFRFSDEIWKKEKKK